MEFTSNPAFARLHDVITRINADSDLSVVLQAIADGVVEVSGFEVATINVFRPEDDTFELVAYGGDDPALAQHLHRRYPAQVITERNDAGEHWGLFRFVSHELALDTPADYIVVDQPIGTGPDAWHPLDELSVTLRSSRNEVIGIMYVDRPSDGRQPTSDVIAAMEVYAVAAGVALEHAQRRAAEHEAVWLADLTGSVLDAIGGLQDLTSRLEAGVDLVRAGLGADAVWLDVFGDTAVGGVPPRRDDRVFTIAAALDSYGRALALHALESGDAVVLDRLRLERAHPVLDDQQRSWLLRALEQDDLTSVAVAPVDNDEQLAGQLVVSRRAGRGWSTQTTRTLREIGREIGWAVGREQSRHVARAAREEVERAARERREMMASLVRELAPTFATLDSFAQTLVPDDPVRSAIDACWATYGRVGSLVSFEDPAHTPVPGPVDVGALLAVQAGHLARLGAERGVRVLPVEQTADHTAWADPEEIEWIVQLVTERVVQRAVPGSSVRFGVVTLNHRVVLSCLASAPEPLDGSDEPDEPVEIDLDRPDPADYELAPDTGLDVEPAAMEQLPPEPVDDPWWLLGVQRVLARSDGRLSTREGPGGRRVVSLSLPAAS